MGRLLKPLSLSFFFVLITAYLFSQTDTSQKKAADTSFSYSRKLFNKLYKNLKQDTNNNNNSARPERNDIRFQKFKGRIIRTIIPEQMDFGIPINDTGRKVKNILTSLANHLHKNTTANNIKKNLFFSENDKLEPYLIADNERYLRDLSYIQDARFIVIPVGNEKDSVDVFVLTKDIFSLGLNIQNLSITNSQLSVTEDNVGGWGNKITAKALYDNKRASQFGYGFEYLHRNFEGSFVDGYFGYYNAATSITNNYQENILYAKLIRPLVNPYIKVVYSLEGSLHSTQNMYSTDSLFKLNEVYHYYNVDAWVGLNLNVQNLSKYRENQRLRGLVSLRLVNQIFQNVPISFNNKYDYHFADIKALLGSFSIFRQDFFKTQYFYGFGRNEDVPEGINLAITGGYTQINQRARPYMGLDFGRYYFTNSGHYLNYSLRLGGFFKKTDFEDVDIFGDASYYTRLVKLGGGWKQRTFLEATIARQLNYLLVEPLFLQSSYGIPEFSNNNVGGNFRGTVKAETVFYSPLNIASFKFAPFIFSNSTLFTPIDKKFTESNLYTSLGGGLRTRNESLIFGTLEFRAYYFPQKNLYNKRFRFEFSSNLKFKYNSIFVKKPDFLSLN